jgi:hypothetical protein
MSFLERTTTDPNQASPIEEPSSTNEREFTSLLICEASAV